MTARAMVELGMIDSMGYGVHQMYRGQAARYFPLPDYDQTSLNDLEFAEGASKFSSPKFADL